LGGGPDGRPPAAGQWSRCGLMFLRSNCAIDLPDNVNVRRCG